MHRRQNLNFDPDVLRTQFSRALSAMYKKEVPLYGDLIRIVNDVDDGVLQNQGRPGLEPRHRLERHGAIRLGTKLELRTIGRLFSILGMYPVGYYDLSVVGFPLHATAFRPITTRALAKNPFRVFTTLLRPDHLSAEVGKVAMAAVLKRNIFTDRLLQLIAQVEETGSLNNDEQNDLVTEALKTFQWHSTATVSRGVYDRLLSEHPMVADIVSFPSAHINHLTPRTLDIDLVQQSMIDHGMPAKERIEGPPRRKCEILLRQTSFKALEEQVKFYDGDGKLVEGSHIARFGEVEQRGAAVTREGRDLYDQLLSQARANESKRSDLTVEGVLEEAFRGYPDDWDELRRKGLTFNCYKLSNKGKSEAKKPKQQPSAALSQLIEAGLVEFAPMTYEDFLPVSAAGIFTSNLRKGSSEGLMRIGKGNRTGFEQILGGPVADEFKLYARMELESIEECRQALNLEAILNG